VIVAGLMSSLQLTGHSRLSDHTFVFQGAGAVFSITMSYQYGVAVQATSSRKSGIRLSVRRHLGFWKFQIFNGQGGQESPTASSCQISSKSLEPRLRYNNFSIFPRWRQVRHLGFVMRVWGPPTKGIWWSLSLCKIWLESMQ